jgi:hypothetical protein
MKALFAMLLGISMGVFPVPTPIAISWKILADVRFSKRLNKDLDMYFLYPSFGQAVRQLSGKEIRISGYMIPADPDNNIYVLSAQPMSMCFFCGGAGPESVIELQFRDKKQRFKTDAVKSVSGKLVLNSEDIEHLNYILKEAVVVQ